MKSPFSQRGTGAFTLVELLCVIAIVGILAALLLPALQKGKARAKLVGCQSNLGQLGIAFHSFAHDHGSKFPMQASVTQGGALELVQNGYHVNGEFYFAYRIFQSLGDDLVTTKILLCPTDTRLAATNFISLRNKNVSYFVGVDSQYSDPESILLGDRNLITGAGRSIYSATGQSVRWSAIMHQFKGNLLFADGHVEESKGFSLAGGTSAQNNFFIPSAKAEETLSQPILASQEFSNKISAANTNHAAADNSASTNPPARAEPAMATNQGVARTSASTSSLIRHAADAPQTSGAATVQISTNATAAATNDDSGMSFFDRRVVKIFRSLVGWGYSLLLLLFLLWLSFTIWRHWRHRQQQRQKR